MMKNMKTGVYTRNGETYDFNFATNLSMNNKLKFVNSVANGIVGNNYNFIIKDLVIDYMIISVFTDVDTSDIDQSENLIDDIELFLEETNIVEIVKANMDFGLFEELSNAIDFEIRYRTGIHPSPISDSIASLFSTLENKINEIDLNSMAEIISKFNNMTGELTPESIVNAYINSDIHKNNVVEIEKANSKQG